VKRELSVPSSPTLAAREENGVCDRRSPVAASRSPSVSTTARHRGQAHGFFGICLDHAGSARRPCLSVGRTGAGSRVRSGRPRAAPPSTPPSSASKPQRADRRPGRSAHLRPGIRALVTDPENRPPTAPPTSLRRPPPPLLLDPRPRSDAEKRHRDRARDPRRRHAVLLVAFQGHHRTLRGPSPGRPGPSTAACPSATGRVRQHISCQENSTSTPFFRSALAQSAGEWDKFD